MADIIIDITLGLVFAFCAVGIIFLLPVKKLFSRKGKKDQ